MQTPEQGYALCLARPYLKGKIVISSLGGGFYGRVFLAEDGVDAVVVKLHLKPGFHRKEQQQLDTLRRAARLPMPRVFGVHDADEEVPLDAILMEYLPGRNAGVEEALAPQNRACIAEEIVENLLAYHRTIHPEGFGPLDAASFSPDWNRYYWDVAQSHFEKTCALRDMGRVDDATFDTVCRAMHHYDEIFCLPVPQACLIHGDYNTWNVLLNEELTHVAAVIDPFGCSWADPELDLYQLNNANGPYLGLMEAYRVKVTLSDNFFLKNPFYETMTELMHYHDSGVDPREYGKLPGQAQALARAMDEAGIAAK